MFVIDLSRNIGGYLYDVFIDKADIWLLIGIVGQLMFTARFLVQWIASERAGKSVIPVVFWLFSIGGGLITLVYGIYRREPIIIMGQALSIFIYIRNLMLIFKNRGKTETGA